MADVESETQNAAMYNNGEDTAATGYTISADTQKPAG